MKYFLTALIYVYIQIFKNPGGNAFSFTKESQQNMFCSYVGVMQCFGFFFC